MNSRLEECANMLISEASIHNCELGEAWRRHLHPVYKSGLKFIEVKGYIDEKVDLGNEYYNKYVWRGY